MQTPDMTYHQWLVGMALCGVEAANFSNSAQTAMDRRSTADHAIKLADEVCRQLDERGPTLEG